MRPSSLRCGAHFLRVKSFKKSAQFVIFRSIWQRCLGSAVGETRTRDLSVTLQPLTCVGSMRLSRAVSWVCSSWSSVTTDSLSWRRTANVFTVRLLTTPTEFSRVRAVNLCVFIADDVCGWFVIKSPQNVRNVHHSEFLIRIIHPLLSDLHLNMPI